jgi:hypothetical protein
MDEQHNTPDNRQVNTNRFTQVSTVRNLRDGEKNVTTRLLKHRGYTKLES